MPAAGMGALQGVLPPGMIINGCGGRKLSNNMESIHSEGIC